jgi:hypothetical protein
MRSKLFLMILLIGSIIYLTLSYDNRKTISTSVKSSLEQHITSVEQSKTNDSNLLQPSNANNPSRFLKANGSEEDESKLQKTIKNLVSQIPSKNLIEYTEKAKETFRLILQDKEVTKVLFKSFGNQKYIENLFGAEQAEARVKLIDFFKYVGSDYKDEILETILEIQQDPTFINKQKGRDLDYRDLLAIHLKTISDTDVKTALPEELRQIRYTPSNRRIVALAILQAYPNLANDQEFIKGILPYLKGEKI